MKKNSCYSGKDYRSRGIILNSIGFKNYQDYLESDLWKRIRKKVFSVKGKRCYFCGHEATQLHHTRYHRLDLVGATIKYLHPICRWCHQRVEFEGKKKLSLAGARIKTKHLRRARLEKLETSRLIDLICNHSSDD